MYVEFGTSSSDSVTLTNTWSSAGLSTAKNYNILARQIGCTDDWKAPTDCVQYFTGKADNIQSYNFNGAQLLQGMNYKNCIRTEEGYCAIQWKQSSSTTPDPFDIGTTLTAIESNDCVALNGYISIPNLSPDGSQTIATAIQHYQDRVCGSDFGIEGGVAGALVSRQKPFQMGVWSTAGTAQANAEGFSMDYTQLAC